MKQITKLNQPKVNIKDLRRYNPKHISKDVIEIEAKMDFSKKARKKAVREIIKQPKTFERAWNDFVVVFAETLKLDKFMDWLSKKI